MNRNNFPLYCHGIQAYQSNDKRKLRLILKNKDLTLCEKKLLKIRLLLRSRKRHEAQSLLTDFKSDMDFFNAEKNALLASSYFFQGSFSDSLRHNQIAYGFYSLVQDQRGQFVSSYNASVDAAQMGLFAESHKLLMQAHPFAQSFVEKSVLYRAYACKYSFMNHHEKALIYLKKSNEYFDKLSINDQAAYLTVAADIYFKAKMYPEALSSLKFLSKFKISHNEEARFCFEIKVLKHLAQNKKIRDWRMGRMDASQEYYLKWKILWAVQSGDIPLSNKLWSELISLSPHLYSENFTCLNSVETSSIFMTYLKQLLTIHNLSMKKTFLKGKPLKFYEILVTHKKPLSKEFIIEKIWNVPYSTLLDCRFYKLVERFKKQSQYKLISLNRSYFLTC